VDVSIKAPLRFRKTSPPQSPSPGWEELKRRGGGWCQKSSGITAPGSGARALESGFKALWCKFNTQRWNFKAQSCKI